MLLLLCWFAVLCLASVATIIAAIMALCLKDKPRIMAIDALLITATIGYLVFQSAIFLPKDAQNKEAQAAVHLDAAHQAGITAVNQRTEYYVSRLDQPWLSLATVGGFKPPAAKAIEEDKAKFTDDARFESWKQRFIGFNVVELLMLIAGFGAIVYFVHRNKQSWLPSPVNYGFRKTYGCILAMLCAQSTSALIAGVVVGFVSGFTAALQHRKMQMPNFSQELLLIAMLSGVIAGLLSAWLLICRPAKTGLLATFWTDNLSRKQVLMFAFGGMFAMSALTSVVQILMLVLHATPQAANEISRQWVDALISNNGAKFMWCALLVCISAPVVEELLFRGLLYPWLRQRVGVILGILGSSLAFGLAHFDPARLVYYIGLGAALTVVYERTRSLRVTTAMHALWNIWALLTMAMLVP